MPTTSRRRAGLAQIAVYGHAGRERVARFIAAFSSHFWTGMTLAWIETNGQWSVLMSSDGVAATIATIAASAEDIEQILWMMRPSKLTAISTADQAGTRCRGPLHP